MEQESWPAESKQECVTAAQSKSDGCLMTTQFSSATKTCSMGVLPLILLDSAQETESLKTYIPDVCGQSIQVL